MEIRIVPVTLATDTDGVTKTARTGVRSATYLLSRDSASSKVIFIHSSLTSPHAIRCFASVLNLGNFDWVYRLRRDGG